MADAEAVPADAASPDALSTEAPAGPPPGGAANVSTDAGQEAPEECISVVARVRPSASVSESLTIGERTLEIGVPRGGGGSTEQVDQYRFHFARVFGPTATQSELFNGAARDLVMGALDGVNCTIFAYGQTGSGKTFTICGGKGSYNDRGIIPRSLGCLFDAIERRRQDGITYTVSVSFIEIYKEQGFNLLSEHAKEGRKGPRRSGDVTISFVGEQPTLRGAPPIAIASEDEGLHQYFLGDTNRQVAETPHNPNSSRSHCLFTISITAADSSTQTVRTSKIQIVDLAGSERLKPYESGSQNDKELMDQAVKINLSLHHLETVINSLNQKSRWIPYRNSFLTAVLKDALGGNARAVMFATVNPLDAALPETLGTCRFSQRVANVQTNARVNEEVDPQIMIAALRQEKAELRAALAQAEGGQDVEDIPVDDLRKRVRAFLEEENDGTTGGERLNVGSLRNSYAAFRIFRELFWELLRSRASTSTIATPKAEAEEARGPAPLDSHDVDSRPADANVGTAKADVVDKVESPEAAAQASSDQESIETLRIRLKEAEGELRMCRAALAAQPPQPAVRPARPARSLPPRRVCTSVAIQTEPPPTAKRSKPKRPTSADARPRGGMRGTIGFSMEDVVDRRAEAGSHNFSNLPVDSRVPDFRTMRSPSPAMRKSPSSSGVCQLPPLSRSAEIDRTTSIQNEHAASSQSHQGAGTKTTASLAATKPAMAAPSATSPNAATVKSSEPAPGPKNSAAGACASAAWLKATTALTQDEVSLMSDDAEAHGLFLRHDPRAADIWPQDLKALRAERLERMEEARALGEAIEGTKEATRKVQASLEALKAKLRDAEAQAAVDPGGPSENTARALRELLSVEEPKLVQLLVEKRQRYELDHARLKELKRELSHLEHGEKKIEATIQAEFHLWRQAVNERYPGAAQRAPAAKSGSATMGTANGAALTQSHDSNDIGAARSPSQASVGNDFSHGTDRVSVGADKACAATSATAASAPAEPVESEALAKAETMLRSLRQRLEEARRSGDDRRVEMLEQLLATEEPRLARMRAECR